MRPAKTHWLSLGIAVMFYAVAGFLVLWGVSSAHLNFLACPDGFSLLADRPECRRPKVLELGALVVFVMAVGVTVAAFRGFMRSTTKRQKQE